MRRRRRGNNFVLNRRPRDWLVDDFDAVEIRRSKSTKFDGAAV